MKSLFSSKMDGNIHQIMILFALLLTSSFQVGINALELDFVRLDSSGSEQPSDLGDYEFFECTGPDDDRSCKFQADTSADAMNSDDDANQYVFGIALYGAVNVVAVILLFLGIVLYVIISCICCLCCSRKHKELPPLDPRDATGEEKQDNVSDDGKVKNERFPGLNNVNKYFAIYLFLVILCFTILIIVSMTKGSDGFTEGTSNTYKVFGGPMNILLDFQSPFVDVLLNLASDVFAPTIESTRDLVNQAVNLTTVVNVMVAVNHTLVTIPKTRDVVHTLRSVEYITYNTTAICRDLLTEFQKLEDITDAALDDCYYLRATIYQLDQSTKRMDELLDELETVSQDASDMIDSMNTNAQLIDSDISKYQPRDEGGIYPTDDDFDDVTKNSSPFSLSHFSDNDLNGDSVNLAILVSRLQYINNNISSLANLNGTAEALVSLNETRNDCLKQGGLIDQLNEAVDDAEDALNLFPDLVEVQRRLYKLYSLVDSIDFKGIVGDIYSVANMTGPLYDDLMDLKTYTEQYLTVTDILNPLSDLIHQLDSINETIMELPSGVMKIYNIYDDVEEDINEYKEKIDNIFDEIDNSKETIDEFEDELQDNLKILSDLQEKIDDDLFSLDFASINSTLEDATLRLQYDFTPVRDTIDDLESAIRQLIIKPSYIKGLQKSCTAINIATHDLDRLVDPSTGDLVALLNEKAAIYSCKIALSPCQLDEDCPGSEDYCLNDFVRMETVRAELIGLKELDIDFGGILSSLGDFDVNNDINFDSYFTEFDEISNSLNDIDLTSLNNSVNSVIDQIESLNYDTYLSDIEEAVDTMESIEFSEYINDFNELGATVDDLIEDDLPTLNKWRQTAVAIRNFLQDEDIGLAKYLRMLRKSTLRAIRETRGSAAAIAQIPAVIDGITEYFHENQEGFKVSKTTLAKDSRKTLDWISRLGAEEHAGYGDLKDHGSLYYITGLFNSSKFVRVAEPFLSGIFTDTNGERYPDDAHCLADTCYEHTSDVINTQPMNTWEEEFPGVNIPLGMTREQLFLILWIFVFIAMLLGILTLICPFCSCGSFYKCQRTPACLMSSCLICQLPWMFLITAFLFPLFLFVNDACSSGSSIGTTYLEAYGNGICTERFKGDGSLYSCHMNKTLPDSLGNVTVGASVNIVNVYKEVFTGSCDFPEDPIASAIISLANDLETVPRRAIDSILAKKEVRKRQFREPLLNIPRNASSGFGRILREFAVAEAESAFNCEHISAVYNDFMDNSCTAIIDPLIWYVGIWYFTAWFMCCCGLPAACLWCNKKPYDYDGVDGVDSSRGYQGHDESGLYVSTSSKHAPIGAADLEAELEMSDVYPVPTSGAVPTAFTQAYEQEYSRLSKPRYADDDSDESVDYQVTRTDDNAGAYL